MAILEELTKKVRKKEEVSALELEQLIRDLIDPEAPIESKAEFLVAFHEKGETAREIADLAVVLRALATDPRVDLNLLGGMLLDTCGTGSDRLNTLNASTAAAFIIAASDLPVAKHGNRSVTSQCGSADVLEELGIQIELPPESVQRSLEETRYAFLFAPNYHKVFRVLQPLRQYLAQKGQSTVFNLIGPLINPAKPNVQVVGVYAPELTNVIGDALKHMGLLRGVAVHGYTSDRKDSGLDEFSNLGPNRLTQLHSSGNVETIEIDIAVLGLVPSAIEDLKGGDARTNAKLIEGILKGEIKGGARDFVLLNASAGLVLGGLARDLKDGIAKAAEIIDLGHAQKKLEQIREFSRTQAVAKSDTEGRKPVRVKIDTKWLEKQVEEQRKKAVEAARKHTSIHSATRLPHPTQLLKPPEPKKE